VMPFADIYILLLIGLIIHLLLLLLLLLLLAMNSLRTEDTISSIFSSSDVSSVVVTLFRLSSSFAFNRSEMA